MTRTGATRLIGLLALLWAAPAFGQGGLSLTLEDAITRGVAYAPRLAEDDARRALAEATVTARAALQRPGVSASAGYVRVNHVVPFGVPQPDGTARIIFPDIPNNYRLRGELEIPLYTGGRVDALVTSAQADVLATAADRRASVADIRLEVAATYWTLVMARERVNVLVRALERSDAMLSDVRARVDTGFLPPNDSLTAQAQRARQQVLLIEAQNTAALTEAQLARLIGVTPGEPIGTTTPADRPTPDAVTLTARPVTELMSAAPTARPERQALQERQSALRAAADATLAATRPQVAALAVVEPNRPNQRFVPREDKLATSWDLGVNVVWSLWDGGRAKAEHAATNAQADAVRARVQEFDDLVALEVRQRVLEISSTQAAIAASAEAVSAATEARRVLGERFAAGVATSTDLLDSDVAVLESELERTRLQATLRINEARLLRAVGDR